MVEALEWCVYIYWSGVCVALFALACAEYISEYIILANQSKYTRTYKWLFHFPPKESAIHDMLPQPHMAIQLINLIRQLQILRQ